MMMMVMMMMLMMMVMMIVMMVVVADSRFSGSKCLPGKTASLLLLLLTTMKTSSVADQCGQCDRCDQCGKMIILRDSHHNHKFCLLLIAHGDDSKHQVDQVEGSKEDDDGEEDDMDWSPCCHHLTIDCVLTIGLGGDVVVR